MNYWFYNRKFHDKDIIIAIAGTNGNLNFKPRVSAFTF